MGKTPIARVAKTVNGMATEEGWEVAVANSRVKQAESENGMHCGHGRSLLCRPEPGEEIVTFHLVVMLQIRILPAKRSHCQPT